MKIISFKKKSDGEDFADALQKIIDGAEKVSAGYESYGRSAIEVGYIKQSLKNMAQQARSGSILYDNNSK